MFKEPYSFLILYTVSSIVKSRYCLKVKLRVEILFSKMLSHSLQLSQASQLWRDEVRGLVDNMRPSVSSSLDIGHQVKFIDNES